MTAFSASQVLHQMLRRPRGTQDSKASVRCSSGLSPACVKQQNRFAMPCHELAGKASLGWNGRCPWELTDSLYTDGCRNKCVARIQVRITNSAHKKAWDQHPSAMSMPTTQVLDSSTIFPLKGTKAPWRKGCMQGRERESTS